MLRLGSGSQRSFNAKISQRFNLASGLHLQCAEVGEFGTITFCGSYTSIHGSIFADVVVVVANDGLR